MGRLFLIVALVLGTLGPVPLGCRNGEFGSEAEYPGSAAERCIVTPSRLKPLIVDWGAEDRSSLEARLKKGGLVPVRYQGCEMEVLRHCNAPGAYSYTGLTLKTEAKKVTTLNDLYSTFPASASVLEATFRQVRELSVATQIVGMLEADGVRVDRNQLQGDCEGATHIISGVQVGAFQFFSGRQGEIGAGVGVARVGFRGRRSSSKEFFKSDGDSEACRAASGTDKTAPARCGALLRLELVALASEAAQSVVAPPTVAVVQPVAPAVMPPAEATPSSNISQPAHNTPGPETTAMVEKPAPERDPGPDLAPDQTPWKPLAIGGAISLGASVVMGTLIVVGAGRSWSLERQFIDTCSADSSSLDCQELDRKGAIANRLQIASLITAPLFLAAGVALLVIAMKRKSNRRQAFAPLLGPRIAGIRWEVHF